MVAQIASRFLGDIMKVTYNNADYECSEAYSFKDFTGHDLSDRTDMSGIIIYGSCFYHENPDLNFLPASMGGTTFIACNLDNNTMPDGNEIIDCSNRKIKAQEDDTDWIVDEDGIPVSPL